MGELSDFYDRMVASLPKGTMDRIRAGRSASGKGVPLWVRIDQEVALRGVCVTKDGEIIPWENLQGIPASSLTPAERIAQKVRR